MKRTITVKGVGSVSAKPDYITLTLSITEKDMDYEKALEGAARRIAQLEGAAEEAGFEKGALKTLHFNVSTQYEGVRDKDGNYQNVFAGYACLYRLKLAFGLDSKRLAAVLTAVAASGAEPELNISFTVKEPARVSEALLASAAANARDQLGEGPGSVPGLRGGAGQADPHRLQLGRAEPCVPHPVRAGGLRHAADGGGEAVRPGDPAGRHRPA